MVKKNLTDRLRAPILASAFLAGASALPGDAKATPIVNATIDYGANEIHYVVENPDNDVFTFAQFSELEFPNSEIIDVVSNTGIGYYLYNGSNKLGIPYWQNNPTPNQEDIVDLLLKYDDTNINELDIPLSGSVTIGSGNQIGNCYNGAGWCDVNYILEDITNYGNNGGNQDPHPVPAPGPLPLTLVGLAALGYAGKKGYFKKE